MCALCVTFCTGLSHFSLSSNHHCTTVHSSEFGLGQSFNSNTIRALACMHHSQPQRLEEIFSPFLCIKPLQVENVTVSTIVCLPLAAFQRHTRCYLLFIMGKVISWNQAPWKGHWTAGYCFPCQWPIQLIVTDIFSVLFKSELFWSIDH